MNVDSSTKKDVNRTLAADALVSLSMDELSTVAGGILPALWGGSPGGGGGPVPVPTIPSGGLRVGQ